jgi:uncharacterized protein (TIGR03435 family)
MRILFLAIPLLLPCFGQAKLEFEVASIKPAPLQPIGRTSVRTSSNTDAGTMTFLNVSLRDLTGQAFKVQQYQISGPEWMNDVRFDISARFTPGATAEQFQQMLQSLLVDRFAMKMHRETKELPVYALVVGKGGSKLKPADVPGGSSSNGNNGVIRYEAKVTMARFAEYLSQRTGRPVLDQTALQGAYEIKMEYSSDDNNTTLPSLLTAIQEELGLKLEATKGPVMSIVVDSVEKTPTEN